MKTFKIVFISILSAILILVTILASVLLAGVTTPNMLSFILRAAWDDVSTYVPEEYNEIKDDVTVVKDIKYPSKYKENKLDIYYDETITTKQQTLLWIHGGGFVSGSKDGLKVFATLLVKQGFTVISMNYELAPESTFPKPLIQVGEAIKHLETLSKDYPSIDLEKLIIGGDSAGAHIAANFASLETNIEVSKALDINQVLKRDLQAVLLYCGPFDLSKFDNMFKTKNDGSAILGYFVNQVGWSYFGYKNWMKQDFIKQTNIIDIVTKDFPATYITDGDAVSFMDHGKELAIKLQEHNVKVDTYFPSEVYVGETFYHEYQFDFENAKVAAFDNFNKTVSFLKSL